MSITSRVALSSGRANGECTPLGQVEQRLSCFASVQLCGTASRSLRDRLKHLEALETSHEGPDQQACEHELALANHSLRKGSLPQRKSENQVLDEARNGALGRRPGHLRDQFLNSAQAQVLHEHVRRGRFKPKGT